MGGEGQAPSSESRGVALPHGDRVATGEHEIQVAPGHYRFGSYDDLPRWNSYWHQIRNALSLNPRTVLEIGSGTSVFRTYLQRCGVEVASVDIDPTREPDFVADVARLDEMLPRALRFDVVVAFEVLEHLPFARFERCLEGMARRARYALVSLPTDGIQLRWSFALGYIRFAAGFKLRKPWPFRPSGEHHWELGWRHSPRRITRIMARHFDVLQRYRIKENPYHYLWVLRSIGGEGRGV